MFDLFIPSSLKRLTRKLLLIGLFFHLVAAWFNVGYHYPDEYFQITEFASYKLGRTPASDLAWEFAAGIRPALQPAMIYSVSKLFNLTNPVTISFLFRLLSAMTAWVIASIFILISLSECSSDKSRKVILYLSSFLWFIPYIHARFSSENWSAIFFFAALSLVILMLKPDKDDQKIKPKVLSLLTCGILLGLSFVTRFQTGFMVLGLGLWLLVYRKFKIKELSILFTGIVFSVLTGVLTDRWFYGKWLFTPLNYFQVNVITGKSSEWGTTPWWDYFVMIFVNNIPPFSILILAGIFIFFLRFPKHLLTWVCVPFLLAHIINPHKELRFLFPLVYALPVVIGLAYDGLINPGRSKRLINILSSKAAIVTAKVFIALNIVLMIIVCLKPANETFLFYDFVYKNYNDRQTYLYTFSGDPYSTINLPVDFYKPDKLTVINVSKDSLLHNFPFKANATNLVFEKNIMNDTTFAVAGKETRIVYQSIPTWVEAFNFNNWLKRSRSWGLYEVH